jgi:hypothetical protein
MSFVQASGMLGKCSTIELYSQSSSFYLLSFIKTFLAGLGFELRASHLLGRCATT